MQLHYFTMSEPKKRDECDLCEQRVVYSPSGAKQDMLARISSSSQYRSVSAAMLQRASSSAFKTKFPNSSIDLTHPSKAWAHVYCWTQLQALPERAPASAPASAPAPAAAPIVGTSSSGLPRFIFSSLARFFFTIFLVMFADWFSAMNSATQLSSHLPSAYSVQAPNFPLYQLFCMLLLSSCFCCFTLAFHFASYSSAALSIDVVCSFFIEVSSWVWQGSVHPTSP